MSHIAKYLAVFLLMVFAMATAPLNLLHHHEAKTRCLKGELRCMHKEHLQNQSENCLICTFHFEKTFSTQEFFTPFFSGEKFPRTPFTELGCSYTDLIGSSLRGPPVS